MGNRKKKPRTIGDMNLSYNGNKITIPGWIVELNLKDQRINLEDKEEILENSENLSSEILKALRKGFDNKERKFVAQSEIYNFSLNKLRENEYLVRGISIRSDSFYDRSQFDWLSRALKSE